MKVVLEINDIDTLKEMWNRLNMNRPILQKTILIEYGTEEYLEYEWDKSDTFKFFDQLTEILIEMGEL